MRIDTKSTKPWGSVKPYQLGGWMAGADGGVLAFGEASFLGSLPGVSVHVGNIAFAVAP